MAYQRNILIIGKTGVGKSSITNAILNKDPSDGDSLMKPPRAKQQSFIERRDGQEIRIEHVSISSTQDDEVLIKNVERALKSLQSLHLVLFVIKLEPIDEQLYEQFSIVMSLLGSEPAVSSITAVLVTWCDLLNSRGEDMAKKELQEIMKQLLDFAERGVHMISLPQLSCVEDSLYTTIFEKNKNSRKFLQHLCHQPRTEVIYGNSPAGPGKLYTYIYSYMQIIILYHFCSYGFIN